MHTWCLVVFIFSSTHIPRITQTFRHLGLYFNMSWECCRYCRRPLAPVDPARGGATWSVNRTVDERERVQWALPSMAPVWRGPGGGAEKHTAARVCRAGFDTSPWGKYFVCWVTGKYFLISSMTFHHQQCWKDSFVDRDGSVTSSSNRWNYIQVKWQVLHTSALQTENSSRGWCHHQISQWSGQFFSDGPYATQTVTNRFEVYNVLVWCNYLKAQLTRNMVVSWWTILSSDANIFKQATNIKKMRFSILLCFCLSGFRSNHLGLCISIIKQLVFMLLPQAFSPVLITRKHPSIFQSLCFCCFFFGGACLRQCRA